MREDMVGRMRRQNTLYVTQRDGRKRREKPGSSEWKTGDVGPHTVARREVETLMDVRTTSIKRADHSSVENWPEPPLSLLTGGYFSSSCAPRDFVGDHQPSHIPHRDSMLCL